MGWEMKILLDKIDSQLIRRFVQLVFFSIVIVIGIQFFSFVTQLENGKIPDIERPAGVEVFLPIGALVSLKYFIMTGVVNEVHPSGLVFFLLVCLSSLVMKKSFCSWVCPFALLSEYLAKMNSVLFKKPVKMPFYADFILRSIKYLLAVFFVYTIFVKMSGRAVEQFIYSPYNVISDIKMLKFFTNISFTALIVIIFLVVLTVIFNNFWCRYLCPYGAVTGFIGFLSAGKIRRDSESCTGCGQCDRVCPSLISISEKRIVHSDECTVCLRCTSVCPEKETLRLSFFSKALPVRPVIACLILFTIFGGGILAADFLGHWQNKVTNQQYLIYMASQGMIHKKNVMPKTKDNKKMERMRKMMEMMNREKQ